MMTNNEKYLKKMAGLPYSVMSSDKCALCGGTETVEIIPHDGGANDAIEEECPICLRKYFEEKIKRIREGR